MARVIPIKLMASGPAAVAEDAQARAHARLEHAGFMRMTMIGEPRLSELVEKYKVRGYEVEVLPVDTAEPRSEPDGNTSSDAGGGALTLFGTIYVRKRRSGDDQGG